MYHSYKWSLVTVKNNLQLKLQIKMIVKSIM